MKKPGTTGEEATKITATAIDLDPETAQTITTATTIRRRARIIATTIAQPHTAIITTVTPHVALVYNS